MAVATYTSSSQTATPKAVHVGVNVARSTFTLNAAASTTISDVIFMVKIPNKATIVDGYIQGTHGGSAHVLKVGTSADDNACGSAFTLSATSQLVRFGMSAGGAASANVLPFKVSLSDDANPQWTWLKAEAVTSGSSSLTLSVACVVFYTMDGDI